MHWFRYYAESLDDPKIGTLNDAEFRTWVEVLCLACAADKDGDLGIGASEINWRLRRNVSQEIEALTSKKLVTVTDGRVTVTNWTKRQSKADSSVSRVQKYRERLKGAKGGGDYTQHRSTVYERDGNKCVYCHSTENLCLDHLVPLIRGGTNALSNLVTACKACNSGKSGRTPDEASYTIKSPQASAMWEKLKSNGYGNGLEKKRKEEIREEEPVVHVEGLNANAWKQWIDYKQQTRKPLKQVSIPAAQKQLAAIGTEEQQQAAVTHSIANGYQGLFAPTVAATKPAPTAQKIKEFPR